MPLCSAFCCKHKSDLHHDHILNKLWQWLCNLVNKWSELTPQHRGKTKQHTWPFITGADAGSNRTAAIKTKLQISVRD